MELIKLYDHILKRRFFNAIDQLHANKSKRKIYLKIAEELNELSLALIQHITKDSPEENIMEEMIDVFMNLNLLSKFFDKQAVEEMFTRKVEKMIRVNLKYLKLESLNA